MTTAPPVTTKAEMYRLLAAGAFGNTIPSYRTASEWRASDEYPKYETWGVRTQVTAGPCRLFCPKAEVEATVESFRPHPVNISIMVDAVADVTLFCEVTELAAGLVAYGIEYPGKGANWRQMMPTQGRMYEGLAAKMLLARHLNPNSLDDLRDVLDKWPGHVVEFSALGRCLGTRPGRNAVVWECRQY